MKTLIFNVLNQPIPAPRSLRADLPRDLETVCLKAMDKEAQQRYANCREMADDLGHWLEYEPIRASRAGYVVQFARWCRRNPVVASLTGALLIAIVILSWQLVAVMAAQRTLLQTMAARDRALLARDQAQRIAEEQRDLAKQELADRVRAEKQAESQRKATQKAEELAANRTIEADTERKRATIAEERTLIETDRARLATYIQQLGDAAALYKGDPEAALRILEDESLCPRNLREFSWRLLHRECQVSRPHTIINLSNLVVLPKTSMQSFPPLQAVRAANAKSGVRDPDDSVQIEVIKALRSFSQKYGVWTGEPLQFSRDGKYLVTTFPTLMNTKKLHGVVGVFDTEKGNLHEVMEDASAFGSLHRIVIDLDSETDNWLIAKGGARISLLSPTGKVVRAVVSGNDNNAEQRIHSLAWGFPWSKDQLVVVTARRSGQVQYSLFQRKNQWDLVGAPVELVHGSNGGFEFTRLATTLDDRAYQALACVRNPGHVELRFISHPTTILPISDKLPLADAVAFSKKAGLFALAEKNKINVWSQDTLFQADKLPPPLFTLAIPDRVTESLILSPDGLQLAAVTELQGNTSRDLRIWKLSRSSSGEWPTSVVPQPKGTIKVAKATDVIGAISPNGTRYVTLHKDGTAHLNDVAETEEPKILDTGSRVWCCAFSPDSRTLAIGTERAEVSLWEVTTGRRMFSVPVSLYRVSAIAFSGNGDYLGIRDNSGKTFQLHAEPNSKLSDD